MINWYFFYGCTFAAALVLSLIATPLCRMIARKYGFLDVPKSEKHKLHQNATPLLGGLAMFSAWFLTIAAGTAAAYLSGHGSMFSGAMRDLVVVCLGGFAAMLLGAADDKYPLKAGTKFIGQTVIALAVVLFGGVRISLFFCDTWLLSIPLTVFWLLFIFNAINFFDNMDGLAAGTSAIAFIFFTLAAVFNQQYFIASLGACSAAATIGFWVYNSSPASIFMGDSGSHFLGFLLGVISSKVTYYNPDVASTRFAVLIPVFILAVPVFDAIAVVIIRLHNHKPVYVGDHNHISHRFLHMGLTRKRSVQMVHLLGLIAGLGALPLLWGELRTCIVLILQGLTVLLMLTVIQYAARIDKPDPK